MGEGLTFRFADRSDIHEIMELIREIAIYEKMEDEVVATEEGLEEWMFEKGKAESLLAIADGQVIGQALFFHNFSTFQGRAGIYLEDLYVRPAWRGKGIGKELLKRLAKITVERGCGRLEWCCLDWNQPSIDFYHSMGAIPMDEWTTYRLAGDSLIHLAE